MTQEEKELLLKDLCGRLPYGVKAEVKGWDEEREEEVLVPVTVYSVNTDGYVYFADNDYDITYCSVDVCRLYLRPMSSMTEEEFQEYMKYIRHSWSGIDKDEDCYYVKVTNRAEFVDFLNAHHLDYHELIPMGLALEATEGMYKTE